MAVGMSGDQSEQGAEQVADFFAQQQCRQQWFERGVHVGAIDPLVCGELGVAVRRQRGQRLQVVAEHLGAHVLHHGLLGQAGDMFQVEA